MKLSTLRKAAIEAGTVILLGVSTVVNAPAATRNQGKPGPEKPSIPACLLNSVCVDDVLRIEVDGEPPLSGRYRVDARGEIDYPFVGRLVVSGLKPAAVAKLLVDGLKKRRAIEHRVSIEIEAGENAR